MARNHETSAGAAQALVCLVGLLLSLSSTGCGTSGNSSSSGGGAAAHAVEYRLEARATGQASSALLKASPYSSLVVEISSVSGREPSRASLDFLGGFLADHIHKPDGIKFVAGRALSPTGSAGLKGSDLIALEAANRSRYASGSEAALYVMFLDNAAADELGGAKVLGLSYQSTSIAVFEDTLRAMAPGSRLSSLTEKTVLAHELGHLFGLVNTGTPMAGGVDHYDHRHSPGHCSDPTCLMSFAVHTDRIWSLFVADGVPDFDDDCLNDLRAAGGM